MDGIEDLRGIGHRLFRGHAEQLLHARAEERIGDLARGGEKPLIDDAGQVVGDGVKAALALDGGGLGIAPAPLLDQQGAEEQSSQGQRHRLGRSGGCNHGVGQIRTGQKQHPDQLGENEQHAQQQQMGVGQAATAAAPELGHEYAAQGGQGDPDRAGNLARAAEGEAVGGGDSGSRSGGGRTAEQGGKADRHRAPIHQNAGRRRDRHAHGEDRGEAEDETGEPALQAGRQLAQEGRDLVVDDQRQCEQRQIGGERHQYVSGENVHRNLVSRTAGSVAEQET